MLKGKNLKGENNSFWDFFSLERWGEEGARVSSDRNRGCGLEKDGEIVTNTWHLYSLSPQGCWSHHVFKVNKSSWKDSFNIPSSVGALQYLQVRDLSEALSPSITRVIYFMVFSFTHSFLVAQGFGHCPCLKTWQLLSSQLLMRAVDEVPSSPCLF